MRPHPSSSYKGRDCGGRSRRRCYRVLAPLVRTVAAHGIRRPLETSRRDEEPVNEPRRLAVAALPIVAVVVFAVAVIAVVAAAGSTLGYDFQAYRARRPRGSWTAGSTRTWTLPAASRRLPVPAVRAGVHPVRPVAGAVALWAWTNIVFVAAFLVGTWLLPVRAEVRWATLLLGGLMWPLCTRSSSARSSPLPLPRVRLRVALAGRAGPARALDGRRDDRLSSSRGCCSAGRW